MKNLDDKINLTMLGKELDFKLQYGNMNPEQENFFYHSLSIEIELLDTCIIKFGNKKCYNV